MNPIALLGVASTGLSLIRNLHATPPQKETETFSTCLEKNQPTSTSIKDYVQDQGLHTPEDLHSHLQSLKEELKSKLAIYSPNQEPALILAFESNGEPYLENEMGHKEPIPQELQAFAKQIGQLSYLESQMAHFPNSSLWNQAALMPSQRWNSTTL